mmetsp:Transcript_100425/g.199328  ORF Transcript_100425/g.199328 Transcript_100425/m.199328 type:complete len:230 (+) Transcript_100425:1872-2561(+)
MWLWCGGVALWRRWRWCWHLTLGHLCFCSTVVHGTAAGTVTSRTRKRMRWHQHQVCGCHRLFHTMFFPLLAVRCFHFCSATTCLWLKACLNLFSYSGYFLGIFSTAAGLHCCAHSTFCKRGSHLTIVLLATMHLNVRLCFGICKCGGTQLRSLFCRSCVLPCRCLCSPAFDRAAIVHHATTCWVDDSPAAMACLGIAATHCTLFPSEVLSARGLLTLVPSLQPPQQPQS